MGQEYRMDVVVRAEELYCVEGQTFEAVATLTGIAASTLKRWSERYRWQDKREEIRQALSSIPLNTIKLRAELIKNCLTTLNAQDAFAVAGIESMALKAAAHAQKTGPAAEAEPVAMREIKTDEDAVAAIEEAMQIKLNAMLANPARLNLAAVKDIRQAMELVRDLRARVAPKLEEGKKKKGLTPETVESIRNKLLMGEGE